MNFFTIFKRFKYSPTWEHLPFNIQKVDGDMLTTHRRFIKALNKLTTKRADPSILERILVGNKEPQVPLKEVALIQKKDAQTVHIVPMDAKWTSLIDSAIRSTNLGLSPVKISDKLLKIPVPKLSTELKATWIKTAKEECERNKVQLRKVRKEANVLLLKEQKKSKLSGDIVYKITKEIQILTDAYVKQNDDLLKEKLQEFDKA